MYSHFSVYLKLFNLMENIMLNYCEVGNSGGNDRKGKKGDGKKRRK